jgi:hypothetical protein
MKVRNPKSRKWMLSFFMVCLMFISAFIGMAGSAQDERPNNENNEEVATGMIVGVVFDIEANPLAGAVAVLTSGEDNTNEENLELKTRSNEHGYFEFTELPRGLYFLRVHLEGYHGWGRELKLPAGETIKVEVKLEKLEERPKEPEQEENNEIIYGVVFGYVYNAAENEPIAGAIVVIHHIESEREKKLETNERGWFEVKLPRGKYVIVVEARGFWPYKEELVVKGNDEQKVRIPLRPREIEPEERPTLCGHIFDAVTDKPIFGWVELSQGSPKIPKKPVKQDDYKLWRTFTNRGGWYEFFNVPPGHYEIRAFAHGHRMFYNELDIEEDSHIYLDIYLLREKCKPEPKPEPIPWSVLSGHVFNRRTKDPVAGAIVCAIPMRLIKERFLDLGVELDDMSLDEMELDDELLEKLGLNEFDWDNIKFDEDMDYDPNENEKPEEDWEKEQYDKEYYEKKQYEKDDIESKESKPDPNTNTRCCDDEPKKDRENLRKYLYKFCARTNDDGNFRLKLPAGAYLLVVRARGYQLFYQRFKIEPKEQKFIRVPLIPMVQRPITDELNEKDTDRPERPLGPGDRDDGNSDSESSTETANLGTSVVGGAAGTSAVLYGVLGILVLIAVILGGMVWRRSKVAPIRKKRKLKTLKF